MNTNKLKAFAREARVKLRKLVGDRLKFVLENKNEDSLLLGRASDIHNLERRISETSQDQVIEEVAYTWFNRIMALRFMDANDYNAPRIVTPADGMSLPEILQEAKAGVVDSKFRVGESVVSDLLDGRTPLAAGRNAEQEVYRLLFLSACKYWNGSLPFLFESLVDYMDLLLPDDLLSPASIVSLIREGMSDEDCKQEQIIGWLYQFYIAEVKEEVEPKKTSKAGLKPEEIPAATQLFTPHWIVRYMVENTLGKIWMTLNPTSELKGEMPYYIDGVEGQTSPMPSDITSVKDIRFIDPCMGSGHVLVYAFELLCKMYEQEGYSTSEIPAMIFENNLYGIDIDPRCTQLANFALSMKAQSYYRRYLRKAVKPHAIALSTFTREDIDSCGTFDSKSTIYNLTQADNLGSLISISEDDCKLITAGEETLFSVDTAKLQKMAKLLSQKYHCVVTNPPYLGKGMNAPLKKFVTDNYPNSKSDLMATFMERCVEMNTEFGRTAMINQHSWMFLSSYEELRKSVVEDSHIESLLHLGPRTFPEIGGEVVQNAAFVLGNFKSENKGQYIRLVDYADAQLKDDKTLEAIADRACGWFYTADQRNFEKIPGSPIGYWVSKRIIHVYNNSTLFNDLAPIRQGMATSDNDRFMRVWSEVDFSKIGLLLTSREEAIQSRLKWFPYNKGGSFRKWYGNNTFIVNWENDGTEIKEYREYKNSTLDSNMGVAGLPFIFKKNITWSKISSGAFSVRYLDCGYLFDVSGCSIYDDEKSLIEYISLLNSKIITELIGGLSPTLNYEVGQIKQLPIIINETVNTSIAKHNIMIARRDWDAHETSWDFKYNELLSMVDNILWIGTKAESLEDLYNAYCEKWCNNFIQLHANEEELNRQFIEIYGLEDELTPDVPLSEITILQQGEIKIEDNQLKFQPAVILKQFMSYAVGCMMGRYSLDKEGLILANQGEGIEEYLEQIPEPTFMPDDDGIIPVLEGEYFLDDITERFRNFVCVAFGEKYFGENLNFLLSEVGDLRKYFYKDFYNDHVKMYKKRPIYWMFSSPKKNFQVLVYMHRMRSDTPSKVFSDYLQPYIHRLGEEREQLKERSLREEVSPREKAQIAKRTEQLTKMIADCEEYSKTLLAFASQRPTIDLDDGVKVNYTKFKGIVTKIVGLD